MNNIFENKEDYLKLVTFWKQFHADKGYKSVKVMSYDNVNFQMTSPLRFTHHIIYLAATGKSLEKAFARATDDTISLIGGYAQDWFKKSEYHYRLFDGYLDPKYRDKVQDRIKEFLAARAK